MTENNKPEWFEIVDADGPATPPKASKTLPFAAVMVTALILGIGAVVGPVQQQSPASSTQENVMPADSVITSVASPVAPVVATTTTRLANPSIAVLPANGDNEDDNEDDDEDEYEEDDD
jgi:hypothetical protein